MIQTERIVCARLLQRPADLDAVARRILDGQVMVYPTETVYGIGGRADRDDVRQRILDAKGRSAEAPMILLASERKSFEPLGVRFPPLALRLADAFWPGRLTLVLPTVSGESVGIRVCDHPFIKAIAGLVPVPVFSTSANRSAEAYDGDPRVIFRLFDGAADFMVDEGQLPVSKPSSVVRVNDDSGYELIREGAVPRSAIDSVARGERAVTDTLAGG